MRLYILRHGKAVPSSESGRDADRELAPRGEDQARWLAHQFTRKHRPRELEPPPGVVLSSEAVRAATTAKIIAEALGLDVQFDDALSLSASVHEAEGLVLRMLGQHRSVMLVGHNPQLSDLSQRAGGTAHLRTGELAVFDLEEAVSPLQGEAHGSLRFEE